MFNEHYNDRYNDHHNVLNEHNTYFVESQEAELPDDGEGRDSGPGGDLTGNLQPDFDDLQRVREHHLRRTCLSRKAIKYRSSS